MDGFYTLAPPAITVHAPYAPEATPWGNSYQVNQSLVNNFWSVRDQWFEERWLAQSESAFAPVSAQVQPPAYVPHESMAPVVMISW